MKTQPVIRLFAVVFAIAALFTFASKPVVQADEDANQRPPLACTEDITFGGQVRGSSVTDSEGMYLYEIRGNAFEVYNIADLSHRVGYTYVTQGESLDNPMAVVGNYVLTYQYGNLIAFDVSDPTAPVELTNFPEWEVTFPYYVRKISVINDRRAILSSADSCHIYDFANPIQPELIGDIEDCRYASYANGRIYDIEWRGPLRIRDSESLELIAEIPLARMPYYGPFIREDRLALLYKDSNLDAWRVETYDISSEVPTSITEYQIDQYDYNIGFLYVAFDGTFFYIADLRHDLTVVGPDGATVEHIDMNRIESMILDPDGDLLVNSDYGLHVFASGFAGETLYPRFTGPVSGSFAIVGDVVFSRSSSRGVLQAATTEGRYLGSLDIAPRKIVPLGDKHIVVTHSDLVSVVDISNPANMHVVGELEDVVALDIEVSPELTHAYAALHGEIVRIDLTDFTSPQVVGRAPRDTFRAHADLAIGKWGFEHVYDAQRHMVVEYYWDSEGQRLWDGDRYPAPYVDRILGVYQNRVYTYQFYGLNGSHQGITGYYLIRLWLADRLIKDESPYMLENSSMHEGTLLATRWDAIDVLNIDGEEPALQARCNIRVPEPEVGPDGRIYSGDESPWGGLSIFSLSEWPTPTPTATTPPTETPVPTSTPEPSATPHPQQRVLLPAVHR